jgi:secondary thiamine-phosphate synthase enzyme
VIPQTLNSLCVIRVETRQPIEAVDVTDRLDALSCNSRFLWVFAPHTTVALIVCEADTEMRRDLERTAESLLSPLEPFTHARNGNPNAAAHLCSALMGTQLLLPTLSGSLALGRWQRVLLLELDGPKERELQVSTLP